MHSLAPMILRTVFAIVAVTGCGGGGSSTGPTTPAPPVQDAFLLEHNAQFNGGRTFRWVAPIPVFTIVGNPAADEFLLSQFTPWETALAGAGGFPLLAPQAPTGVLPSRGIFFQVANLPAPLVGFADPFTPLAQLRRTIPELTGNGEVRRCVITLDPSLAFSTARGFAAAVRHEVGHCLGFEGHVPSGLMQTGCNVSNNSCSLTITEDVGRMMRTLYTVPPGTPVIP